MATYNIGVNDCPLYCTVFTDVLFTRRRSLQDTALSIFAGSLFEALLCKAPLFEASLVDGL